MHIKIDKEKINGSFELIFKEEDSTDAEKADFDTAVAKNGKVIVDFGGTFTEDVTKDVTDPITNVVTSVTETVTLFKFNENLRDLSVNLPYTRVFKKTQYGENAERFAELYANKMDEVITEALQALKDEVDNFSSPDIDIHY